ncbi:MAG: hypothetical protein QOH61_2503 [Chloroflexota bacterium]|jgi:hypothetical protein|nr:hypothetical protein [Chloroflexota bacterium]
MDELRSLGGVSPLDTTDAGIRRDAPSIDDPGLAQPTLGRLDDPEPAGSLDQPADDPAEGRADIPGGEGADMEPQPA